MQRHAITPYATFLTLLSRATLHSIALLAVPRLRLPPRRNARLVAPDFVGVS
ncbi:MAG: hypothetical protein IPP94_18580 [Ignavibacteria bacterium]|nr:hypothetical protein [Ignavibacteria bacterium]